MDIFCSYIFYLDIILYDMVGQYKEILLCQGITINILVVIAILMGKSHCQWACKDLKFSDSTDCLISLVLHIQLKSN